MRTPAVIGLTVGAAVLASSLTAVAVGGQVTTRPSASVPSTAPVAYTSLTSPSNVPVTYVRVVRGWVTDPGNSNYMLRIIQVGRGCYVETSVNLVGPTVDSLTPASCP